MWNLSALATTVLFNLVVMQNTNSQLQLNMRSFSTIRGKLASMARNSQAEPHSSTPKKPLFHFHDSYPNSNLSVNALRCRLKPKPDKGSALTTAATEQLASVLPAPTQPTKRQLTSCESYRAQKRKCGSDSKNPMCTEKQRRINSQRLDSYFTTT